MTTTATQALFDLKDGLTFNVFYNEDTTTHSFLQTIVLKNPWEWAMLRQLFEGRSDVELTLVDRYIETPFHCLLAALFCKQIVEELGFKSCRINLALTPLKKEKPGMPVKVNGNFGTTANRDAFLSDCFKKVTGMVASITTRRNHIRCRDLKVSTADYSLYIRVEGGIARGWQPVNRYLQQLPASELLEIHRSDLPCSNAYVHGHSRNGVFVNIELQTKKLTNNN